MAERQEGLELLLKTDPSILPAINFNCDLARGIFNNTVLNSTLAKYISDVTTSKESSRKLGEYRAALLILLSRSRGELSTPEEPTL